MNTEIQDISNILLTLNDSVNKHIYSSLDLQRLDSALKKINLKTNSLNKLIYRLSLLDLTLNDDKVIDLLIAIHRNFSQSIARIYAIRKLTTKMIHNYEREWHKVHNKTD